MISIFKKIEKLGLTLGFGHKRLYSCVEIWKLGYTLVLGAFDHHKINKTSIQHEYL
jgi:hypothetical protein